MSMDSGASMNESSGGSSRFLVSQASFGKMQEAIPYTHEAAELGSTFIQELGV